METAVQVASDHQEVVPQPETLSPAQPAQVPRIAEGAAPCHAVTTDVLRHDAGGVQAGQVDRIRIMRVRVSASAPPEQMQLVA